MSSTHLSRRPIAVVDNDDDSFQIEEPDSPPHPKYEYTELPYGDSIRLLELLPGDPQSSLRCRLPVLDLNRFYIPKYAALSYTWGDSKYDRLIIAGERISMNSNLRQEYAIRHPIYCGDSRLLISTNLRDALRRLRHPTLPMKLWVDALCINQEDDMEKSRQIMLMPRIYHSSKLVWLWVGGEDEGSETAFNVLGRLASEYLAQMLRFNAVPTEKTLYNAEEMTALRLPTFESGFYQHVAEVLQRPVFRRMWCVQEVVSHTRVVLICGPKPESSLPYEKLIHAIKYLAWTDWKKELEKHYHEGKDLLAFVQAEQGDKRNWDGKILDRYAVAYDLRNFQATDPRDKIYGLLGLLGNFAHRGLGDLTFDNRPDPCTSGHTLTCAHHREQTSNYAQNRWEAGEAEEIINYAANTGIYHLKSSLSALLSVTIDFVKNVLVSHYDRKSEDAGFRFNLPAGLGSYRKEVDGHLVKLWTYLDEISIEHVSSAELVANRYASELLESLFNEFEKVYKANVNNRFVHMRDTQLFLEWLETMLRLMRGEGEFNSDYDSADEYDAVTDAQADSSQPGVDEPRKEMDAEMDEVVPVAVANEKKQDDPKPAPVHQSDSNAMTLPSHDQGVSIGIGSLSLSERDDQMDNTTENHNIERGHDHDHVATCEKKLDSETVLVDDSEAQVCCPLDVTKDDDDAELNDSNQNSIAPEENTHCTFTAGVKVHDPPSFDFSKVAGLEYMKERTIPDHPIVTTNAMPLWGPNQQVLPDYSLSTEEVYRDFTTQCIIATQTLDFLSLVQDKTLQELAELPSWVPDYSVSLEGKAAPLTWPKNRRRHYAFPYYAFPYCAAGTSEPAIKWSASCPNVLEVSGYCFDTIAFFIDTNEGSTDGLSSQAEEWKSMAAVLAPDWTGPEETGSRASLISSEAELYQDEWIETLGMGETKESQPPPFVTFNSWSDYICGQVKWFNRDGVEPAELKGKNWCSFFFFLIFIKVQQCGATNDMEIENVMDEAATMNIWYEFYEYQEAIMAFIKGVVVGRRMGITVKGRIVYVPLSTEEGDALCLLKGGRVPYVVRKGEGDDEVRYSFVGEAFSWDDMHGDAVPDKLEDWVDMELV